jgi:phospholipid/cholesterol/gamma-HCH transport system permease protein
MKLFIKICYILGANFLEILNRIGERLVFIGLAMGNLFFKPIYFNNLKKNFIEIAFFSLPVVAITAFFTGMVLALQTYIGFSRFSAQGAVANVVVIAITRELAPVLTALMVAGRIAGAIAAEIGTMKVSEQLDALYTMGVNPIKYLITPKIIAGILSLPLLVIVADILGVFGGFVVSVLKLDFNATMYLTNTMDFITLMDITTGIIKGAVFGLIITSIGCFYGYFSSGGAKGVGVATTNAVVISCMLIFLFDYLLTSLFFGV